MKATLRIFLAIALSAVLSLLIISCGGGGGGDSRSSVSACEGGWVTIANPTYTSICNSTYLEGEAFISPTWWRCCSRSASDTGVTVTVNGQPAYQTVDYGIWVPLYNHRWSASVDLSVGNNLITVTATDPAGLCGQASIVVNHPFQSYSISGKVNTPHGAAASYTDLTLTGEGLSLNMTTDIDGFYIFSCLPNGFYTVAPSKLGYVFSPNNRDTIIAGSNVTGEDFTEAFDGTFSVSGTVYCNCSGIQLLLNGTTLKNDFLNITTWISNDFKGNYSFTGVPNGTYTITSLNYSIAPQSRTVTVFGADVSGQDFN